MDADKFAEIVRGGSDKLRVDNVILEAGDARLRGRGLLRIERDRLEIDLTLNARGLPEHSRVITKKDFWRMSGLIANGLAFRCDTVSPGGTMRSENGILSITRRLYPIELVVEPPDSPKAKRRRRAHEKMLGFKPSTQLPDNSFQFEATIVDCPLPAANGGTETVWNNDFLGESSSSSADTFCGELETARYALIRARNGTDLEIHFRSKEGVGTGNGTADWRKFRAFLAAFGFATGAHPWAFRTKYSRGWYRVSETIGAARKPSTTTMAAMSEAIGFTRPDDFGRAIKAAAEFLEPDTKLNNQLSHLLFLFREAGKDSINLEIKTLACCALLESLVRQIFEEVCSARSDATDVIDSKRFLRLKNALLRYSKRLLNSKNAREHQRISDRIRDAAEFQIQDIFKAVGTKLAIPWEETMLPLFREWKRARNPSAHGRFKPGTDNQKEAEQQWFGISRVAGGFNMILLRLFGYSGTFRASALEDSYRKLYAEDP